jgi:hypothetical protein
MAIPSQFCQKGQPIFMLSVDKLPNTPEKFSRFASPADEHFASALHPFSFPDNGSVLPAA